MKKFLLFLLSVSLCLESLAGRRVFHRLHSVRTYHSKGTQEFEYTFKP